MQTLLLSLFLFQGNSDWPEVVKSLGFPVVIAIGVLYFGGKLIWKIYCNIAQQIKDKDDLLKSQIEKGDDFRTKIVDSQNRITSTQDKISQGLDRNVDTLNDIKDVMRDNCKFQSH